MEIKSRKALSLLFLSALMFISTMLMPFTQVSADQVTDEINQTVETEEANQENTIEPYRNSCGINGCNENPAVDACVARAAVDSILGSASGVAGAAFGQHIRNGNYSAAAKYVAGQFRNLNFAGVLGQLIYFEGRCIINNNYA